MLDKSENQEIFDQLKNFSELTQFSEYLSTLINQSRIEDFEFGIFSKDIESAKFQESLGINPIDGSDHIEWFHLKYIRFAQPNPESVFKFDLKTVSVWLDRESNWWILLGKDLDEKRQITFNQLINEITDYSLVEEELDQLTLAALKKLNPYTYIFYLQIFAELSKSGITGTYYKFTAENETIEQFCESDDWDQKKEIIDQLAEIKSSIPDLKWHVISFDCNQTNYILYPCSDYNIFCLSYGKHVIILPIREMQTIVLSIIKKQIGYGMLYPLIKELVNSKTNELEYFGEYLKINQDQFSLIKFEPISQYLTYQQILDKLEDHQYIKTCRFLTDQLEFWLTVKSFTWYCKDLKTNEIQSFSNLSDLKNYLSVVYPTIYKN